MFNKICKKLFIFIAIFAITISNLTFAATIDDDNKIGLVGDSFAGYYGIFEGSDPIAYYVFDVPTIKDKLNIELFLRAILDPKVKYVLLCTGVNDFAYCVNPIDFESDLMAYAIECKKYNKYLFLHTYMMTPKVEKNDIGLGADAYDNALKNVARDYSNVFYIDMHEFENVIYLQDDSIHYKKEFYDSLRNKIMNQIENIGKNIGPGFELEKLKTDLK